MLHDNIVMRIVKSYKHEQRDEDNDGHDEYEHGHGLDEYGMCARMNMMMSMHMRMTRIVIMSVMM